jgi:serine/threonine kinase 16
MCVLGGDWMFPDEKPQRGKQKQVVAEEDKISEPVKEVVRRCLRVEPSERPDVDDLIEMVMGVLSQMPEDGEE